MIESCEYCSTEGSCPFSFSEQSAYAQNTGCLPGPIDIVTMRVLHGKTWACHSNDGKPCLGALDYMREIGLPYKVIDRAYLNLDMDWHNYIGTQEDRERVYKDINERRYAKWKEQTGSECTE